MTRTRGLETGAAVRCKLEAQLQHLLGDAVPNPVRRAGGVGSASVRSAQHGNGLLRPSS
jgi:hypothetical protein